MSNYLCYISDIRRLVILLFCFFLLLLLLKMSSESHNTRLGGMKQELLKNEFNTQLPDLSNSL